MRRGIRLWLDDYRPVPDGWVLAVTAPEAIKLLRSEIVIEVSLDYDLGDESAGTGYEVACVIEEGAALGWLRPMTWAVHSASEQGQACIRGALESADRWWARSGVLPAFQGHVVLLGDSVFDNGIYAAPDPAVVEHLRRRLGPLGRVTLLAKDGATTHDVARQIEVVPADATHLVISSGGNDALQRASILATAVSTVGEGFLRLADVLHEFSYEYDEMLAVAIARKLPMYACTIYDPAFDDPATRRAAAVGLAAYNDVIRRAASTRGLDIIDLRSMIGVTDLTLEIEPSGPGGEKIAGAVARAITGRSGRNAGPSRERT